MENNQATPTPNDDPMIGKLIFIYFIIPRKNSDDKHPSLFLIKYQERQNVPGELPF